MERYLDALHGEIAATPRLSASTIFIGGGTPNTIGAERIAALLGALRSHFSVPSGAEITIEANPDPQLCEAFADYRRAGITRLSIGVQSFDESELRTLGRRHTAGDVAMAMRRARDAGFENVSLDLIFGVPGQTPASLRRSLDAVVDLEPEHVSTYGLTIEEGTPFERWHAREPSAFATQDAEAEMYAAAMLRLSEAGYEQYEISNFARPGYRCRHNLNYWTNGEYVGLGVGAASFLDGNRSVHTRDFDAYVTAAQEGKPIPGTSERLEGLARLGEAAMLALRTAEGVDLAAFRERYGVDFSSSYQSQIGELQHAGMLEVTSSHVRLTRAGRFVANDVCSEFIA